MRTFIITSCLVGSGFIILLSTGFFSSLLLFLLVGQIPGSNATLSPETMQLITSLGIVLFAVLVLARNRRFIGSRLSQFEKSLRTVGTFFVDRQNRLRP